MQFVRQVYLGITVLTLLGLSSLGHAQSSSAPPLQPNEKIVKTKDGCGIVIDNSRPSATIESETIAKLTWDGPCIDGLAMGEGWVSEGDYRYLSILPSRGWAWYGRRFGAVETRVEGGTDSSVFIWDGKYVSYSTLSTIHPVWEKNAQSRVSDGTTLVITSSKGCILEAQTLPECKLENKFDIPGVTLFDMPAKKITQFNCPNPRSTQGCEALWALHAGPVIERIKAFIAENEPKAAARKREIAPLIGSWRPLPQAEQIDAARHAALRTTQLAERNERIAATEGKLIAKNPEIKAGPVAKTASLPEPTAAERIAIKYDERIDTARAQCNTSKDSCDTGCTASATVGLLAALANKGKGANEASEQVQQCTNRCDQAKSSCEQQLRTLAQEKSQAIAAAKAPPPSASGTRSGSVAADTSPSITCDGKCALLVAEAKCKPMKASGAEALSCLSQNGAARDDTPEICAQAKSLTGCMTKKEKDSTATPISSKYGRKYDSVCERNFKKIEYVIQDKKIAQAAATYDLFLRDINWYSAKIFEPCIGSNAEAARLYKSAMDAYNQANQYCAAPHPKYECTQWGSSGGISDNGGNPFNNPAWYAAWKAEVDKALANPDYSAELGSVTGAGAVNAADAACAASLTLIENKFTAARRDIPANSVVVLSEASMWVAAASIERIKAQCPQSDKYKMETARLQSQYKDIKRACDASASNPPCVPRLPGKDPAPAPQSVTAPLPPLQNKLPASCDEQSGANFKQCLQAACARQEGTLRGRTCLTCDFASGAWTRCPRGSEGVNSNQ